MQPNTSKHKQMQGNASKYNKIQQMQENTSNYKQMQANVKQTRKIQGNASKCKYVHVQANASTFLYKTRNLQYVSHIVWYVRCVSNAFRLLCCSCLNFNAVCVGMVQALCSASVEPRVDLSC